MKKFKLELTKDEIDVLIKLIYFTDSVDNTVYKVFKKHFEAKERKTLANIEEKLYEW